MVRRRAGFWLWSALMSIRSIRVTVRGAFDQLTHEQCAELLAEAAEHDFRFTEYTPDGHLAYDLSARPFFTFRFSGEVDEQSQIPAVTARCEAAAAAWLTGRGFSHKSLSSQTVDLSEMPLGKRGRREATRTDR